MIDQKYRVRVNREPLVSTDKRTMRKKRWIMWGGIAGGALLVIIVGLILLGGRDEAPEQAEQADVKLSIERGDVQVKKAGDADFSAATDGMSLEAGATVRTESDTLATLELVEDESGSAVRLDSDTRVEIDGVGTGTISTKLASGQIWVQTVGTTPAKNEVVTEVGRASVGQVNEADGTAAISFDDGEETARAIAEDSVVFIDEVAGGLDLDEGQQATFDGENAPEDQSEFETEDIDEDFIESLWYRWNTEQDSLFSARLSGNEDTDGPTLTITEPKAGFETEDEQVEIKGSTDVSATVTLDDEEIDTEAGDFAVEVDLKEGENKFTIIATDAAGNETKKIVTIIRKAGKPDAVSVSLDTSETGSILVTWDESDIDDFGSYEVKRDDEVIKRFTDQTITEYLDEDVAAGESYTYNVCVTDADGQSTCSQDESATAKGDPNKAPTVSIAAPADEATAKGGTAVNFSASGSDPDGEELTYTWEFGDGVTTTGKDVSHTYSVTASNKTVTVTVTVTDRGGASDTSSITLTVTP